MTTFQKIRDMWLAGIPTHEISQTLGASPRSRIIIEGYAMALNGQMSQALPFYQKTKGNEND